MPGKGWCGEEAGGVRKGAPHEPIPGHEPATWSDELGQQQPANAYFSSDSDTSGDRIVLSLSDLLPDSKGEVVLSSATGPMAVNITTDQKVIETGTADHYVTLGGVDVFGYHFCTFAAGVTIYYPAEIDLVVTLHVS